MTAFLKDVIGYGTHAARPAAGSAGALYFESDRGRLVRDNGTTWDALDPFTTAGDLAYFDGTNHARLPAGTAGQVLTMVSGEPAWAAAGGGGGGSGLYSAYLLYQDQKTSGTDAGTFSAGSWVTRTLNTEVADTGNHGTLAANQVTLDAGTYLVRATAPTYQVNAHQLRVQDITAASTLAVGGAAYVGTTTGMVSPAFLVGRFTLGAAHVIELQHQCQTTHTGNGLGNSGGFTTEVYATLELWKE